MPLIELRNIARTYRLPSGDVVEALRDLSLDVERGDYVAIVGASGSGKSTLMNILGLLDRPDAGSQRFAGEEVSALDAPALARMRNRKIGFVFQAFHLLPRTSALENVELPLVYSDRDDIAGLGERALRAVGLADRMRHTPAELSGGQQQRVAIARALVNEPDLLLADEPTGNLDANSAAGVMAIFDELHRAGTTVVLITHDPAVAAHSQRIVRLDRGRVVADEAPLRSPAPAPTPAAALEAR